MGLFANRWISSRKKHCLRRRPRRQFVLRCRCRPQGEYTLPGISQSVIITRMEGRTPVPDGQKIADYAAHQATMVIFLSASLLEGLQKELIRGGYDGDTPAAIVYKASWPDEKVYPCTVATLSETAQQHDVSKTASSSSERSSAIRTTEACCTTRPLPTAAARPSRKHSSTAIILKRTPPIDGGILLLVTSVPSIFKGARIFYALLT